MADETQPVTIRLDRELHREASAVAKVIGQTFRKFVEDGIRGEITKRINADTRIREVVQAANRYTRGEITET